MCVTTAFQSLNNAPHCGDAGAHWRFGNHILLCLVDGLGHGKYAEQAAQAAINHVAYQRREPIREIFSSCNETIRNTRGVAMGLVLINVKNGELIHGGIGNIRALVVKEETTHLGSDFGIVGGGYRSLSPDQLILERGDYVIMTTDGLVEIIDLNASKILDENSFEMVADKILRRWSHDRDDAGVLVYQFDPKHLKKE